jgi:copper resistance protein C
MNKSTHLCTMLLLAASAVAHAHAHLKQATPADGSILTVSPGRLVLRFSEAARLTAASIQKAGAPAQKLKPLPMEPAVEISVALPSLGPASYVVSWRVVGDDGHIVPGQLHFTIVPPHPAARAAPQ